MSDTTTFPTTIDSFLPVEETHLQLGKAHSAIVAIETRMGLGAKVGTDIAATGPVVIGGGTAYEIGALSGNIDLTFGTTGATEGDRITLLRTGTTAHTVTCINGGAGAGTMCVMPASTKAAAEFEFINANWRLLNLHVGDQTIYANTGDVKVVAPAAGSTVTLAGDLTTTGGNATVTVPAAGATISVAGNLTTTGAFTTSLTQGGNTTLILPTANATLASTANITGKKGIIPLPVGAFTKADGTALAIYAADNAGTVGTWGDGTKVHGLRWNNTAGATDTVATSFQIPPDCDVTVVPTLKVRCAKVGATAADIPAIAAGVYAQTDGALYDAGANLGGAMPAIGNPATTTVQMVALNLTAFPSLTTGCTLTLNPPAAQMTTDDLVITQVWIEYTKALG